jgi:hypothetical protein
LGWQFDGRNGAIRAMLLEKPRPVLIGNTSRLVSNANEDANLGAISELAEKARFPAGNERFRAVSKHLSAPRATLICFA